MTETDGRFELRGYELFLDGDRLPVSPAAVRAVIERRGREIGDDSLDEETVNAILRLERTLAISLLTDFLKEDAA